MKNYTIKKGNHYASGFNFKLHSNLNQLNFKAKLSTNCLYQFGDVDNFDINKLYGVTWSLTNDKNSFRIGWNCQNNNGMIQYFAYMHVNGAMQYQYLFEELPEVVIDFQIDLLRDQDTINIYRLNKMPSFVVPYSFSGISTMGYYNFPYFGGNKLAPQTMNIGIE